MSAGFRCSFERENAVTFQPVLVALTATALLVTSLVAEARPSNKWRLEFSGSAKSDGEIVIALTPEGGDTITTTTAIEDNTGENAVAKAVVKSLKAQLSEDQFHVERDDGEDVLIKKRHGQPNFDVVVISNSVKHVRIHPERE
jgi:hypothetical protein